MEVWSEKKEMYVETYCDTISHIIVRKTIHGSKTDETK